MLYLLVLIDENMAMSTEVDTSHRSDFVRLGINSRQTWILKESVSI